MATLNMDGFSEEFRETAPMECACYLFECLSEEEKIKTKEEWVGDWINGLGAGQGRPKRIGKVVERIL